MAKGIWKTRDGRQIPIVEMTDDHLANAILFLRRAHARYVAFMLAHPPCFQGEMAQQCAEEEWLAASTAGPDDLYPIFDDLVFEADRRAAQRRARAAQR